MQDAVFGESLFSLSSLTHGSHRASVVGNGQQAKPGPAEMPMNPVSTGIKQVPHNMDGDLNTR